MLRSKKKVKYRIKKRVKIWANGSPGIKYIIQRRNFFGWWDVDHFYKKDNAEAFYLYRAGEPWVWAE